jgi:hypothetical protein
VVRSRDAAASRAARSRPYGAAQQDIEPAQAAVHRRRTRYKILVRSYRAEVRGLERALVTTGKNSYPIGTVFRLRDQSSFL